MKVRQLIKKIQFTEDEEILCSDCLDQISRYVDLEVDGKPQALLMPRFEQHIKQCKVCQEEYDLLRELAQLEREERLPSVTALRQQLQM